MPDKPLSFQDVIMRLDRYWADQGCLIWQPYSEKVGAGTANPATVLRVLGPEPWNVAYVEPSYRPDDGRYAENPNRMQMHTQYQVILKPAPADVQELYLGSLAAIGIDRDHHDVRFVEDNWESPALGAWGLGWEVWLDGMEITQFTYFQQAGGYQLDPVPVELTYGLERIVMFLQGVREVWQINWDGVRSYGDVLRLPEIEHCTYDFEVADVDRLKQMYDLFEAEARNCLAHKLVIPAHDYVLRCSHTFNLLDARGAIGVTERAHYFARMRDLARQVSIAYVEQRERLEYPWLGAAADGTEPPGAEPPGAEPPAAVLPTGSEVPLTPGTFLLEIGVEEIPANDLPDLLAQLGSAVPKMMADLRLAHGPVTVTGTPRRLVASVESVSPRQSDEEVLVKGPPADRAFDPSGSPTQAASGFARKYGLPVEALELREEGGGRYVYARVRSDGRPAYQVLQEALPGLVAGLRSPKSMRWNASNTFFARPLRWLVSLLGDTVTPFGYAGIEAGRTTTGPRAAGSPQIEVPSADAYPGIMREHQVMVDRAARRVEVKGQVDALAQSAGGRVPEDPGLLDEVTDLVEQPIALLGSFDPVYLALPKDVLVTVMKKHQRYFPVVDDTGKMLPHFIAVRNGGTEHLDEVRAGNEGVLRARYADAAYFYKADSAEPLASFTPRLRTLTFQEKLGSMLDKVQRVRQVAPALAPALNLSPAELQATGRAAELFKSDLATQMVVELTSLQGIMGEEYALRSGESEAVARAIREHYLPRSQGDALPSGKPGLALGIANRLDSLVGLFAVGLAPTATADPFGLRRDALGLVQALVGREQPFDLRPALRSVAAVLPLPAGEETLADVLAFIRDRLYAWLRDQGLPHDAVTAVLAEQSHDPYRAAQAARALAQAIQAPGWPELLTAYARSKRIVRSVDQVYPLAPEHYRDPATAWLHEAVRAAARRMAEPGADIERLVKVLRELQGPINRFFTDVLVMADDPDVRRARLALVQRVAALPDGIADLSQLQGF
jgi:glycyl-tRNA synthetase